MAFTTEGILSHISGSATDATDHFVFLNFKSRNSVDTENDWRTNRIALKVETLDISTNRTVPSFPLPFSGAITGESTTLAIDMGMATKSISLSGIITEQTIIKRDDNDVVYSRFMTAYEVAQLIHASVDSSFLQTQQNIGELIIFMPSRVAHNYNYHADVTSDTPVESCPLVPWTWASRSVDQELTVGANDFPDPISNTTEVDGVQGFIQSFGTNIVGGQPFISFTMSFEIALIPLGGK